jgi:hypothetical protein
LKLLVTSGPHGSFALALLRESLKCFPAIGEEFTPLTASFWAHLQGAVLTPRNPCDTLRTLVAVAASLYG